MRLLTILACRVHQSLAEWHSARASAWLERNRAMRRPSAPVTVAAAERMLLASITGLSIAGLWIWFTWKAMH